jgi:tetratricopeptide (TPR) repeat protein
LETNLLPLEKKLIESTGTENIDAYTFYLKGRDYYYNYNAEDNDRAIELFNRALDVDSNYALALAGLADAYNQRVGKFGYSMEWYDSALYLSKKALKINPNLAEGYKAIGLTYDNLGETELALTNYERAIKLNPNFASAILNYGQINLFAGKYDEAFYWFRRANSLEPDNIWVIISIGNVYKYLRCYDLSIEWGKKAVSLDPENTYILMILGDLYFNSGNVEEAKKYINKSISINNEWVLGWFFNGMMEAASGNYKLSKEYLDKYMKLANVDDPEYFYAYNLLKLNKIDPAMKILEEEKEEYIQYLKDYPNSIMDYNALAEIHAILNEKEKAFETWENAIEKGWLDIGRNTLYPYFENLKNEPEYQRLLNMMQDKVEKLKSSIKTEYPEYEICD